MKKPKSKKIVYYLIDVPLEKSTLDRLANIGLRLIRHDRNELINYAANYILKQAVKGKHVDFQKRYR